MMPVFVSRKQKKIKHKKLRHNEYYNLQETFDTLHAKSKVGEVFNNLMEIISSEENIKLAYRNIKRNTGSKTSGVDKLTIKDIESIASDDYVKIVQKKMSWYKPRAVRRVEIPKPNGKMRPLGIPAIWDRIVQQCILQVLEPICEAKFYRSSYGFRPNKSAENAIADCYKKIQRQNIHFVVDIDIKGFFDNVNHTKLIKQMWHMGIRDKKLICIIKEMLKVPIIMPNGEKIRPTKGTPQGGILSPLLSNIVPNELDWWIASQWENILTKHRYAPKINYNGSLDQGSKYRMLKKTHLKEMWIVRYADDFKIFCRKRSDADKIFIAVKQWLRDRLKLEISEEKSKVVNLKRNYSEFLGIKLKIVKKGRKYVIRTHMCDKAMKRTVKNLKNQIKEIQSPGNEKEEWRAITQYNSMVIGIHNYYRMATNISLDMTKISRNIDTVVKNRLRERAKKSGSLEKYQYIRSRYGRSRQMRFVNGIPLCPVGYIQTKTPKFQKRKVNKYTVEGREEIHKKLGINMSIFHELMEQNESLGSVEYMDNRISLYVAQNGKCAVTEKVLNIDDINCHHRLPRELGGGDNYSNLIIMCKEVHILIHATEKATIAYYLEHLKLDKSQLSKINRLRKLAQLEKI